jgi:hypothetical protein
MCVYPVFIKTKWKVYNLLVPAERLARCVTGIYYQFYAVCAAN